MMNHQTLVKLDGMIIREIPQTEQLCLLAIEQTPYAFEFVINQTEKICLLAVQKQPSLLKLVKNKTVKVCFEALKHCGHTIKYINNPSERMCIRAVTTTPLALKHIKDQTIDICKQALEGDPNALKYAQYQPNAEQYVRDNINLFKYLKEQSYDLCKYVVSIDGLLLAYVHKPTRSICEIALEQNKDAIYYVPTKYIDFYEKSFDKGADLECMVQTFEICKLAVEYDSLNILKVRDHKMSKIYDLAYFDNECLVHHIIQYLSPSVRKQAICKRPYLAYDDNTRMIAVQADPCYLAQIPRHLRTKELYEIALAKNPKAYVLQ